MAMTQRSAFDAKYWNLSQASAWVEFREQALVERFATADRDGYGGLLLYPSMWPTGRRRQGTVDELRRTLEEGRLTAWGYHVEAPDRLEEVPTAEWSDFVIRPPFAYLARDLAAKQQRWSDIRVLSADMKRLWRSETEVSGRSKYDWLVLREMYEDFPKTNPKISKNELIVELQGAYEERFKKTSPSRSSIQNKIKTWL